MHPESSLQKRISEFLFLETSCQSVIPPSSPYFPDTLGKDPEINQQYGLPALAVQTDEAL